MGQAKDALQDHPAERARDFFHATTATRSMATPQRAGTSWTPSTPRWQIRLARPNHINTGYGGGGGTGFPNYFSGGATAIADGTSPSSYGTVPPYSDGYGTPY